MHVHVSTYFVLCFLPVFKLINGLFISLGGPIPIVRRYTNLFSSPGICRCHDHPGWTLASWPSLIWCQPPFPETGRSTDSCRPTIPGFCRPQAASPPLYCKKGRKGGTFLRIICIGNMIQSSYYCCVQGKTPH